MSISFKNIEDLLDAIDDVFLGSKPPRYLYIGAQAAKLLRKYRPAANRCVKAFKPRALARKRGKSK